MIIASTCLAPLLVVDPIHNLLQPHWGSPPIVRRFRGFPLMFHSPQEQMIPHQVPADRSPVGGGAARWHSPPRLALLISWLRV